MESAEFETLWKRFEKELKGDLNQLSDRELSKLTKHYMTDGIWQMNSKERVWIFITESNTRSAEKIAKTGIILTRIAILVGAVQILISIFSK